VWKRLIAEVVDWSARDGLPPKCDHDPGLDIVSPVPAGGRVRQPDVPIKILGWGKASFGAAI
jgi:hypothetical protein